MLMEVLETIRGAFSRSVPNIFLTSSKAVNKIILHNSDHSYCSLHGKTYLEEYLKNKIKKFCGTYQYFLWPNCDMKVKNAMAKD